MSMTEWQEGLGGKTFFSRCTNSFVVNYSIYLFTAWKPLLSSEI